MKNESEIRELLEKLQKDKEEIHEWDLEALFPITQQIDLMEWVLGEGDENKIPQDFIVMTYNEIFTFHNLITDLGGNEYYLNEGGDGTQKREVPKSIALKYISEEEFNRRKN